MAAALALRSATTRLASLSTANPALKSQLPTVFGRAFASSSSSSPPTPRLHQPLGTVPSGTDLDAVREKWGSDAMEKIDQVPVIEVDGDVAICTGGPGALGHPVEYIKLLVSDEDAGPQVCKYCGLRYARKQH